jgi:DNA-binding CsgD family transcriptional regulator
MALAMLPYGVITIDTGGSVCSTNPEAERILGARDGLTVRNRRLQAGVSVDAGGLERAIAAACATASGTSGAGGTLLRLRRPSLRPAYQVLVAPVPARASAHLFGFEPRRVGAVIVISDSESGPRPAAEALQRLFYLTPSQARLAAALAGGKRLAEYARDARVTEGTARQQLKDLFSRTGTRRQAELVRLLLTGVAQLCS